MAADKITKIYTRREEKLPYNKSDIKDTLDLYEDSNARGTQESNQTVEYTTHAKLWVLRKWYFRASF